MIPVSSDPAAPRASMVYVTCRSPGEAAAIARTVVGERLAACANIIEGMTSVYWWDGNLTEDGETVLLLKTVAGRIDDLTARIKVLHSYDVPCVVEIPLAGGNAAYFDWIAAEATGA